MLDILDTYDWKEAFVYAENPRSILEAPISTDSFTREDVKVIIAMDEGENDGPDWLIVMRLFDGRYAFLKAGCDYTGWD